MEVEVGKTFNDRVFMDVFESMTDLNLKLPMLGCSLKTKGMSSVVFETVQRLLYETK